MDTFFCFWIKVTFVLKNSTFFTFIGNLTSILYDTRLEHQLFQFENEGLLKGFQKAPEKMGCKYGHSTKTSQKIV